MLCSASKLAVGISLGMEDTAGTELVTSFVSFLVPFRLSEELLLDLQHFLVKGAFLI